MNHAVDMNHEERLRFIESHELADEQFDDVDAPSVRVRRSTLARAALDPSEDELRAAGAVVEGNIVAFTEGMARESKEDIMDSLLFASLVANKAFNQKNHRVQWYAKYIEVLTVLGWISTNWNYEQVVSSSTRFTMEQAGLDIISSVLSAATLPLTTAGAMIKVATDTVSALKTSEKPLRLFERHARQNRGGSVRIVTCNESQDGTVTVVVGAVSFETRSDVTNVLFWEWNKSDVETYKEGNGVVLNSRQYGTLRDAVQKKLSDRGIEAIEEFEI
ncbi:hypothetical protein [Pseudomonas huanghezhanensis]|uniref:hypothetical protein n=1 Tax=Pseudomonas huanghezhanensis TaxID=3002903 RepID=UPI0022853BB1|nr:hypothetical protein [Pseudomonas sp. BSw22131]